MKIKVIGNGGFTGSSEFEYAPGYVFTGDPACTDYDWFVVFDELPRENIGTFHDGYEQLRCPREHTILCTWEPISIKSYSRAYTRQFGHLLTNRPESAENHPHYHLGRGYFPWFVGRSYQEILAKQYYPKTKTISAVFSAKRMRATAHHYRYDLVHHLKRVMPELDWFGRKFNPIDKKYKLLDDYRYHLVVENHIAPYHWSEKYPDPILCECLPFYAGDPLLDEVMPPESFIRIPADNPTEAERIIREAIANDEWSKRLSAIREAKHRLLTKYNFWAQVIEIIEASKGQSVKPVNEDVPIRIYARRMLRWRSFSAFVDDVVGRVFVNLGLSVDKIDASVPKWAEAESARLRKLSVEYRMTVSDEHALVAELVRRLGVSKVEVKPLDTCVWPVYSALTDGGDRYFVKLAPTDNVLRTLDFLKSVRKCGLVARSIFDNPVEVGFRSMLCTEWRESKRVPAEKMSDAEAMSLLRGIELLSLSLQEATNVLPADGRDSPTAQYAIVENWSKRHRFVSRLFSSLISIPAVEREYGRHKLLTIHGDMHMKNYGFSNGALSAVFDFDTLVKGLPCEDVSYAFTERMRKSELPASAKRRLLDLFSMVVKNSSWPIDEWRIAVNHARLRIASRRLHKHPNNPFVAIDVARRDRELIPLLEVLS